MKAPGASLGGAPGAVLWVVAATVWMQPSRGADDVATADMEPTKGEAAVREDRTSQGACVRM